MSMVMAVAVCLLLAHPAFGQSSNRRLNADEEFFEARIRPLLIDHCYDCHSAENAEGGLQLDVRAGWATGGESGPAIVPGDPSSSLLVQAIRYRDESLQMPPSDAGGQLTDQQIADVVYWIRHGAFDPRDDESIDSEIEIASKTHWAFQPITRPTIPDSVHPIDFLIDQRLGAQSFQTTPIADMRTLVRRASFDLTGLPPSPAQLTLTYEEFPELIDELLASPRYGERWGRHWLDVARYSDAKDGVLMYGDARIRPFAYTYRDYVIRSFNDDKPFDEFVREQIAADQLHDDPQAPELAAMGLLTLGRMFDRNRPDIIDDQIDVISRGLMGLTVSCARCHDHKFDPVPTADYYSLYGVFASTHEPLDRPRIEEIGKAGETFEAEFQTTLNNVLTRRQELYDQTLERARQRTPQHLVQVATTDPDLSETSVFFLSLTPEQLRPHITYRWRQLVARRAYPEDPIFGPWHDLMNDLTMRPKEWQERKIDERIIDGLVAAQPRTPEEVALVYGNVIRQVWGRSSDLASELADISARAIHLESLSIDLADIVGGGDGLGNGVLGYGIHPTNGDQTTGETGFIEIDKHDQLISVDSNPFIDGVFVPKGDRAIATSTGIEVEGQQKSSGQTWDFFKNGPSSGFTTHSIREVDYSTKPNSMLGLHANKGITFDLDAIRTKHNFEMSRFRGIIGNAGAKDQSQLDVAIYLDGELVQNERNVQAEGQGREIDLELPIDKRFLTLVVTEGEQGISHDQAILGNPRIYPADDEPFFNDARRQIDELREQAETIREQIASLPSLEGDPIAELLTSKSSPVWFPIEDISRYLSRQEGDSFRGMVQSLDAVAVRHHDAAARAMIVVDNAVLDDPVIFTRGDPTQRGGNVPRQFLELLSDGNRRPFSDGSGRLELADAIASDRNPLTARVWVNRIWMHHFGEPLVENPSDFGLRTEKPVHHDVLDYLAQSLIENGWQSKPIHRLIMTSNAWKRSSLIPQSEAMLKQLGNDPENKYYWRYKRRRLDMEQMRDSMLSVSGELDNKMFGRPTLITDLENRRRSIYAFVERQNVPNIVQAFDFANPDTSSPRRITTTVPQQALFALNSPFVLARSNALAERAEGDSTGETITNLYMMTLGRTPTEEELELSIEYLELATVPALAQVLLVSNEFMFID